MITLFWLIKIVCFSFAYSWFVAECADTRIGIVGGSVSGWTITVNDQCAGVAASAARVVTLRNAWLRFGPTYADAAGCRFEVTR